MSLVPVGSLDSPDVRLVRLAAPDIDCSGPWLFWPRPVSPVLRRGLEAGGQMTPVVIDGGGPRPVLVAGMARVACLAELGREVLCLDVGSVSAWDKGLLYIQSNLGLDIDDARLVAALRYFAGLDASRLDVVFESLGLVVRSKTARLAQAWLALPEAWDALLARGALPLACAEVLAGFPPEDLGALESLFASLSWSRGNALNVLTWIQETCLRENDRVRDVLGRMDADRILRADLSPKDAMARLTQAARRQRYPELTRMERDFETAVVNLGGTRWRITQPDRFETDGVELSMRVSGRADLERAVRDLVDLAAREAWRDLFSEESR
ncbi:MAG: hypothetical protein EOL86_04915 [Deltaproteobacteria bacterium]|nr:hypothetical protein [Deltaproteobacteria bacterium]